jgi:hypothetical protein
MKISAAQAGSIITELWTRNDGEGRSRNIIWDTILEFDWKDWKIFQDTSSPGQDLNLSPLE